MISPAKNGREQTGLGETLVTDMALVKALCQEKLSSEV